MQAKVIGAVEACKLWIQYRSVCIIPEVEAYKIHLEGEVPLYLRGKALQARIAEYLLVKYLKRPVLYTNKTP